MDKPNPDVPNCSTCKYYEDCDCSLYNFRLMSYEEALIERIGCLSHPQAREYLMKDVIEELERRSNYDRTAYVPANIRKTVLEECIALIKGVE